jgi:putative ABC transport system permease protein
MRLFGFVTLALRRLLNQSALVACVLLGMTMAVAFASAIPAFVNGAQLRVLRNLLTQTTGRDTLNEPEQVSKGNPLFMRFSYVSQLGGKQLTLEELRSLEAYMRDSVQTRTILPVADSGVYIRSDRFRVWPDRSSRTGEVYTTTLPQPLTFAGMSVVTGIEDHIVLQEGELADKLPADGSIPVLVFRSFADKFGVRPGDVFSLTMNVAAENPGSTGNNIVQINTFATVTGVWEARNDEEDFWFVSPFSLSDTFLVTREVYETKVAEVLRTPVDFVIFNYNLDDRALQVELVDPLVTRINTLRNEVFEKLRGMQQQTNLSAALVNYAKASAEMTFLMVAFAAPLFVIVLYFIVLVSGMVIRRQEAELITYRSRGASPLDIIGLYLIQSVMIGLIALVIGMPLGYVIGAVMNGTRTFMDFSGVIRLSLPDFLTSFDPRFLPFRFAVGAAIVAMFATMLPALSAARSTVVLWASERARSLGKPLWQRLYLDFLLLIPVVYGYFQLQTLGNIGLFGQSDSEIAANPLRDPVRYLLPMLMMTCVALILARVFPFVMRVLAGAIDLIDGRATFIAPVLLAARELARAPREYLGSLLLLVIATGIATFGASTAKTLDGHLTDSVYFVTGADLRLEEDGNSSKPRVDAAPGAPAPAQAADDGKPEYFSFLPPEDHLSIDGVRDYARIAEIPVRPDIARQIGEFSLLALDSFEAGTVMGAAFRPDYASEPLISLMNRLGAQPDGLLVTPLFLQLNKKAVGDPLVLQFRLPEGNRVITYTIAGFYENFPTLIPEKDQFVFIGNMDHTHERLGKILPYNVMLTLDSKASGTAIGNRANEMGYLVKKRFDARALIDEQQQTPERQGLFGILTAGFFASITLTVIGFVLYSVLSYRRRAIELGVLRTLGLSSGQMAAYLILNQLIIVAVGTAAGAGAGILASRLFIPFFQVTGRLVSKVPEFYVRIAYDELGVVTALIGATLGLVILVTLLFLSRLRVFEAVKLGAGA